MIHETIKSRGEDLEYDLTVLDHRRSEHHGYALSNRQGPVL